MLTRLCSQGYVVVIPWEAGTNLGPDGKVPFVEQIIGWVEANLYEGLVDYLSVDPAVILDFDNSFGEVLLQ